MGKYSLDKSPSEDTKSFANVEVGKIEIGVTKDKLEPETILELRSAIIEAIQKKNICLTDGVFDLAGSFHQFSRIDSDQATIIFREKVFAMMKGRERISDGLVENMRNWHHSGFSVHNEVVIGQDDREALGRLAQYVVHASFAEEKIRYVEKTGCVIYKPQLHRGKKRNFEALDAVEFLHRACMHIPDPYEAVIRYYGHYANAARGKRRKIGLEEPATPVVVDDAPDRKTCRRSWARLIY